MNNKEMEEQSKSVEKCDAANLKSVYPSAKFLVNTCFSDYQRLLENYSKLYEKINITLAFMGIILTIMTGTLNLSSFSNITGDLNVGHLFLTLIEIGCCILGMGLCLVSVIRLLWLLKGKEIPVFNSVDLRDDELYRESEETAAVWLISKYSEVVFKLRPIVNKKQKNFDSTLTMTTVGIILYTVSVILQKGGF